MAQCSATYLGTAAPEGAQRREYSLGLFDRAYARIFLSSGRREPADVDEVAADAGQRLTRGSATFHAEVWMAARLASQCGYGFGDVVRELVGTSASNPSTVRGSSTRRLPFDAMEIHFRARRSGS